jgi:hypothetical protein
VDTSVDQTEPLIALTAQKKESQFKLYSVMEPEDAQSKKTKNQPREKLSMLKTRDGELSILTNLKRLLLKDSTLNSVSMSTDHSTLSQDSQCKELQNVLEPAKSH